MQPIIKIENLSKMYRLGVIGTGTIRHDLNRWWHKIHGKVLSLSIGPLLMDEEISVIIKAFNEY